MKSQSNELGAVFLPGPVWSGLCCLVGSSGTVKAWPGHSGAGRGQRGESEGARHYSDASPTTTSHFRPLWFGLGGWPPASWSSLIFSYSACSLSLLMYFCVSLPRFFHCFVFFVHIFSLLYPVNINKPSIQLTLARFTLADGAQGDAEETLGQQGGFRDDWSAVPQLETPFPLMHI